MSSGRQAQEYNMLSAKYTVFGINSQPSFSKQLTILNNIDFHRLMTKKPFKGKPNLTINMGKSASFTIPAMKKLFKKISPNSNLFEAELWHFSKRSLTCLGHQKSLSSLKLNLYHPRHPAEHTFKNLAIRLPNLSKLHISFAPNSENHDETLIDLAHSLAYFPHLTTLSLNFSALALTEDEILTVVEKIQCLKNRISHLKLDLSRSPNFSSIGIKILNQSLMKLERLSSLELDFSKCPLIENQDIEKLMASVKMIKSLALALEAPKKLTQKSLQLLLGHENSRPEEAITLDIAEFAPESSSFSHLTRLHLDLNFWPEGETGIPIDFGGSFRGFPNLEVLELNLGYNQMLEQRYLTEICISLIRLKALSKLHLNFSALNNNLTSQAIINLGHALKTLTLVEFKLDVSRCLNISQAAWISLFQSMSSLVKLTNLSLNFADCKGIHEHEFQQLALSLKEMTSLISLDMNFWSCHLHDAALQNLGFSFKNLRKLQVIKAVFAGNKKISSKGFLSMSSGLTEAQSLTKMTLGVDSSILLESADKPSTLISCLGAMRFLNYLKIQATMCSEAQLLALSNHLIELDQVPCIKLHFFQGDRISPNTKSTFIKNMRRLKGLREFELAIDWNNVRFDGFDRIKWNIKDIQAGSWAEEIARYEEALTRKRRSDMKYKMIILIIILSFVLLPLLICLIP